MDLGEPMAELPADIAVAREARNITLQVASRRGDRVAGGHLKVVNAALELLRDQTKEALDDIERMQPRDYWPDANLDPEEYFVLKRSDVEDTFGVLAFVDAGADTDLLDPGDMAGRLLFYSIVLGGGKGHRVAFVSKSNPARTLGKGGVWLTLLPDGDALRNVDTPLFLFEDRVDLVVGQETLIVRNQLAFEQWFRESPAITENVHKWVDSINEHLPFAEDGVERLRRRAETNSRIRRLLRNINERGHLKDVPLAKIRGHIRDQGLSERDFIKDDKLVIPDDPGILLKVLNEDLFTGGLTGVPFVSDNKAPRG
jgi:hypothetical protein